MRLRGQRLSLTALYFSSDTLHASRTPMFKFMRRRSTRQLALFTAVILCGCAPGANQSVSAFDAAPSKLEPVVLTIFTEKVELFMKYPRLWPGEEARFLAHITVLATGEPVRTGSVRLEIGSRILEAPQPRRDGLFIPVGKFESHGEFEARIVVTSNQVEDVIPLPPVVVHASRDEAKRAASADHSHALPNEVPFLLEQQWSIGLLMVEAKQRTLTRRLQVPGEVEAPHHSMAMGSAPVSGLLLPPDGAALPELGDRVEAGQVLAFLDPPLTTSDSAQLGSNQAARTSLEINLLLREFEFQSKTLEVNQAQHQANARVAFAEQALARIEELREKGLGTVADLQVARRDLEIASRAEESARGQGVSLDEAKQQFESLKARSANAEPGGPKRHPIIAPISGVIVEVAHVEGEHVESQEAVYRVLDVSHVWIATHVSEFDFGEVGNAPGALLEFAAYPDRTFDVIKDLSGRVVNIGRVVDPETRTIKLHYEANNPDGLFRAGMLTDVFSRDGLGSGRCRDS